MKPTAALILTGLLTATALPARAADNSWVFTPSFASQYMFRGARLGGPCLQPALEYNHGSLVTGLWGSFPLRNHVADGSEPEVDFYGSYTVEVARDLTVVPG
ncbi:MAG: hypothetical protein PSW75_10970, partial [bacterium]|nr:hypothetical protein [bacterium]